MRASWNSSKWQSLSAGGPVAFNPLTNLDSGRLLKISTSGGKPTFGSSNCGTTHLRVPPQLRRSAHCDDRHEVITFRCIEVERPYRFEHCSAYLLDGGGAREMGRALLPAPLGNFDTSRERLQSEKKLLLLQGE